MIDLIWFGFMAYQKLLVIQCHRLLMFRLWSLWTAFTNCCSFSWLPILLRSDVEDPFFIHRHIFTQKYFFDALKQLQRTHWIVDALLFLIDYVQTQQQLWTQLSHWQIFIQNGECTACWYLKLLWYLTQLQFTISQKEFVEFFSVFRDNYQIGEPERPASFMSVRPRLKSAYHLLTIVFDGAESG